MKKILINVVLFQIGWLVCVVGGDLPALLFTLPVLVVHHWLVMENRGEWKLIIGVVAVGCVWDIAMVQSEVIQYPDGLLLGIPLWLICLWLLFATTFMHALFWLRRYLWLAAPLAGLLGPASYWVGSNLSDASLSVPLWLSLGVMAGGWMILFPGGLYYAGKLKT